MNSFGRLFRITTFGESHGPGIGVVIDGLPGGVPVQLEAIQKALARRRPGQSAFTTPRQESDSVEVLSGLYQGATTGAPLTLWIVNQDARPADYAPLQGVFRPSHADFTYQHKYHNPDPRGGGRSSARETAARVAAGAIAQQLLAVYAPTIRLLGWTAAIGPYETAYRPTELAEVEASPVRCPDPSVSQAIEAYLAALIAEGDTVGGVVAVQVEGLPIGLGEPLYDKLPARLAYAMLSINAARGFEIGEGLAAATMRGSVHNDPFAVDEQGQVFPVTNHAGGVLGGISTGAPLFFRVAFKPIATLKRPQSTVTRSGEATQLIVQGRHDPCPVPRAVPIVEAMTWITLADFVLLARATQAR